MVERMRTHNYPLLLPLGVLVLVAGGCGGDSDAREVTNKRQAPAAQTSASGAGLSPAPLAPPARSADRGPLPPAADKERPEAAFEYPFPDREDLFLLPTRKPPTDNARLRSDSDVELMGFANFGGARVVLRVDGIVTSLRVGETRGGVRVLAIDPPGVLLERGDQRWTENLADAAQSH